MMICTLSFVYVFFFFNDTATTEIYTLSLHDALPIWRGAPCHGPGCDPRRPGDPRHRAAFQGVQPARPDHVGRAGDRKSTRLNSSHGYISYAVFCLKKKKNNKHASRHILTNYRYLCSA